MKNFKTRIFTIALITGLSSTALAMNNNIESIQQNFALFKTIDERFLADLAEFQCNDGWSYDQMQMSYVIKWDHWVSNSQEVEEIPLNDEKPIIGEPEKYAHSINKKIFVFKALVEYRYRLNEEQLLTIIKKNIDKNKPVMIYFKRGTQVLLTTIIGYEETKHRRLMLLNGTGPGYKRFSALLVSDFLASMKILPIFQETNSSKMNRSKKWQLNPALKNDQMEKSYIFITFQETGEGEDPQPKNESSPLPSITACVVQ